MAKTKTFFIGTIPAEVKSLIRSYSSLSGKRDYTSILKMYLLQNFVLDVNLFKNTHLSTKSLSTYMGMIKNATKGRRVGYEDAAIYNFITEVAQLMYPIDSQNSVSTPKQYLERKGWLKFFTESEASNSVQLKLDIAPNSEPAKVATEDKLDVILTPKVIKAIHNLFKDKRFKGGYVDLWLKSYMLCQYQLTNKLTDIAFQGLKIKKVSLSTKLSVCRKMANNLPYQEAGYGRIIEFIKELKKIVKPFPLYTYKKQSGRGVLEILIEKLSPEDKQYLFSKLDGTNTISKERAPHKRKGNRAGFKVDRISRKDLPAIEVKDERKEKKITKSQEKPQEKPSPNIEVSSQIKEKENKKKSHILLIDKENHTFQETELGEEEIREVFDKLNLWNKYDIAKPVVS